jgi:hypothetical protein
MANKPNTPQNPARTLKFALALYAQGERSVNCVKKVSRARHVTNSSHTKTRTCHTENQIHNFFTGTTPEGKNRLAELEKAEKRRFDALYEKLTTPKGKGDNKNNQ